MFALGAGMFREMTKKEEYFVLVCGPESSGKTVSTFLRCFSLLLIDRLKTFAEQFRAHCDPKFQLPKRTTPTIGFESCVHPFPLVCVDFRSISVVKFNVDGFVLNFWDVGGNEELQSMWDRYVEDCHAIVFVVDSCADGDQFEACLRAINKLMNFEHAHSVPLMIVLNKCDLLDAQPSTSLLPPTANGDLRAGHETDTDCEESRLVGRQRGRPNGTVRNGVEENGGWTSQDEANYEVYRAYGWDKPDFVPPEHLRTPSQSSFSSSSSTRGPEGGRNCGKKNAISRAHRSQRLRDACQEICEPVHRADMAVFSISALKSTNIDRCK
ncbi:ADP-ribosylation factor-related protein 1 isoform X1 [Aphelenchoides fujianensis]|nr:ADP-ribosylation factor-related protein 1 isoform X1 [Aphelenchoides fujianensis]